MKRRRDGEIERDSSQPKLKLEIGVGRQYRVASVKPWLHIGARIDCWLRVKSGSVQPDIRK